MYGAIPLVSTILNNIVLTSNFYPSFKQIDDVIAKSNINKESEKGKKFNSFHDEIRLESVNFKYPNGNVLIEDCNIKIKKNNKITSLLERRALVNQQLSI